MPREDHYYAEKSGAEHTAIFDFLDSIPRTPGVGKAVYKILIIDLLFFSFLIQGSGAKPPKKAPQGLSC